MDVIPGWNIPGIFRKIEKLYSSEFVRYIFINFYRSGNHKMYRTAKNGINTGLFKIENDAPMEWVFWTADKNYFKYGNNKNNFNI